MIAPPRLASQLLQRRLHPDERDELLGDLDEQHRARVVRDGARAASRWYWRQAIALAWGFAIRRRDVVSASHERVRGAWAIGTFAHDWRIAGRSLRHSPAFALVAFLTLTFGIGLSTAVFSLVDGILLSPLPYRDSYRIVRLSEIAPPQTAMRNMSPSLDGRTRSALGDTTIGVWSATTQTLDAFVPVSIDGLNVTTAAGAEQIQVAQVGGQFFDALSIAPLAGRLLHRGDDDPSAAPVAVITRAFGDRMFTNASSAVGKSLQIENDVYTIVGVAPEISIPEPGAEIWRAGRWTWPPPGGRRMLSMSMEVFGRMKPGVTVDAVRREGQQAALTIASANPAFYDGNVPIPTIVVTRWQDDLVASVRPALIVLLAGMAVVLLAACVNLANLVLARSTARHREIAVRLALGASRARVARPILFEQLLLAGSGAVAGGVLAWWILSALPRIAPADLPRLADVAFNGWSLAFATGVAFVTACAAALLPAWQLPSGQLRELTASSRFGAGRRTVSGDRVRAILVVCQVALAAVLLVSAMLIGRSLVSLLRVDPGYRPDGVLTFQVSLPEGWWQQKGRVGGFLSELISRLEHTPGVTAAGATSALPLHQGGSYGTFFILGRPPVTDPSERPTARYQVITGRYFEALGLTVTRGRALGEGDVATGEPVVLIDEMAASAYFPGEDPIGQKISHIARVNRTIVGIVKRVQSGALSGPAFPTIYYPAAQITGDILTFNRYAGGVAVRTSADPESLLPVVRSLVRELDPGSPVFNAQALDTRLATTYAQPRFYTIVLALFSALALTTAMLGIYGILAYMVERQRTEIGVRRALGATEQQVLWLVFARGFRLAAIGLAVGLVAAAASSRLLRAQLFGIGPFDPITFAGVSLLVATVVALASWWPASRAVRVDPARALRTE